MPRSSSRDVEVPVDSPPHRGFSGDRANSQVVAGIDSVRRYRQAMSTSPTAAPGRPFGRVLTAMVTPFDADGALDLKRAIQKKKAAEAPVAQAN